MDRPTLCAALLVASAARVAGQQPVLHSPLIPANGLPVQLDVADVNGDGHPDLVVLDGANALSAHLGDGLGAFGAPLAQDLGTEAQRTLAAADFDGDGLADVALTRVVQAAPDEVRLLLSAGDGSFVEHQVVTLGGALGDLDTLDIDGDGDVDLLCGNGDAKRLGLFLGDGAGSLGPRQDILAQGTPQDAAEGDLDGDGDIDLVACSELYQSLCVLLSDGAGGWGAPTVLDTGINVADVQLGDVDGDGDLDAVAGSEWSQGLVALGDGRGGLGEPQILLLGNAAQHVAVADADEDGLSEAYFALAGDAAVAEVRFDAPVTFAAARRFGTGDGPADLRVVDINGDGDVDIVSGNGGTYGGDISILPGNGGGWFAGTSAGMDGPVDVAFGDLDADGQPDLASVQTSNGISAVVSTLLNQGLGAFGPRADAAGTAFMTRLQLADLDGDGDDDVAAIDYTSKLFTYASLGNGTLAAGLSSTTSSYPREMALGDLDGDGAPDIAVIEEPTTLTSQLEVRLGTGAGGFGASAVIPLTGNQRALTIADVTGDGELDVVTATYAGVPSVSVLPGIGDGTFAAAIDSPSFVQQTHLASGDLDEDGDLDVVADSSFNNAIIVLRNDGGGSLAAIALLSTLAGFPRGVEIADFDQDGHLDAGASAVGADFKQTGTFALYLGHGDMTLDAPLPVKVPRIPMGTAVADVDGDGAPDLGIASLADQVAVLLNARGPWQPLGYALAGTQGLPRQIGKGTLQPGSHFTIALRDARPLANAALVAGLSAIYAPFKGGTYVPTPQIVQYPLPTDADGSFEIAGTWPGPAAPGVELFLQFWIQDPLGPKGWEASGAVKATLP